MRHFFTTVKSTLSKSPIYEAPENNKAGEAITYMLKLSAFVAVIYLFGSLTFFVPALKELKGFALEFLGKYPEELVVKLDKGKLSMNQPSPYVLKRTTEQKNNEHSNFLVIDTEANLDLKTYESYDTYALITADGYMIHDDRSIQTQSFKDFPDYTLNKTEVDKFQRMIETSAGGFIAIITVVFSLFFALFMFLGSFIGTMIAALFASLVSWAITKVKGHSLNFEQLYALSLYGLTVVFIVKAIEFFIPLPFFVAPVIFIALISFLVSVKQKEAPQVSA